MPFAVRLYLDVHRCGDVRVTQNLLNKLVANSESAQIHCDHQIVSAYRYALAEAATRPVEVLSKAIERLKGHLRLLARNQPLEQWSRNLLGG
jgi:hypothetical protein